MDSDALRLAARAAREQLAPVLGRELAIHVAAHGVQPLALGDDVHLVASLAQSLRHLPSAGWSQPVPQLSEEQVQRLATAATVAVERVMAERSAAVGADAGHAVGRDVEGDHEVVGHDHMVSPSEGARAAEIVGERGSEATGRPDNVVRLGE